MNNLGMILNPDTSEARKALNRLAREQIKLRLLAEYLDELLALMQELRKGG